jgi:tetratricopeptide (TPR) repeat protein
MLHAYVKECGHALVDVGDLEAALQCFKSLPDMPQPNDEVFRDLDDDLSIALVQTLLGKTDDAHESLRRCEAFFPDDDDLIRRKNDSKLHIFNCKPDKQELALALYKRYQARQANLMYIAKDFPNSLQRVAMIEKAYGQSRKLYAPVRFLGVDLDTLFISATYHIGTEKAKAQAMSYALEAILRADANGDHHDAMKYKILLGRFYRRKDDLINAQVCLSQVQKDLRTYGCSERVFFAAYSESGKILDCNRDFVRAYASFHRPFLMRAAFRKFSGASQQAHAHCVDALALIEIEHSASSKEEWVVKIQKAQADHATEMKNYQRQLLQDGRVRDPMYGYSLSKTREVIDSLKDVEGIKLQMKKTKQLKEIAGIE